jgi:hypothetical protein
MRNLGKGGCREPLGKGGSPHFGNPWSGERLPSLRTAGQGNSVAPCELRTKGASITTSLCPWRGCSESGTPPWPRGYDAGLGASLPVERSYPGHTALYCI